VKKKKFLCKTKRNYLPEDNSSADSSEETTKDYQPLNPTDSSHHPNLSSTQTQTSLEFGEESKMALAEVGSTALKQVESESESTEQTTLSESVKDLGDKKVHEKSAKFEGSEVSKSIEKTDNSMTSCESSSNVMVTQSVSKSVSNTSKMVSKSVSSSQSFSSEEVTEFEEEIIE